MITFISVLLLLAGLALTFATGMLPGITPEKVKSHRSKGWKFLVGSVCVFMLNGAFFYADAGTAYAVQYVTGGDQMIATQGLKAKWWGRTIPISYEISVKDVILGQHLNEEGDKWELDELPENTEGIYNRKAHRWEFSDAIKADISTSVIVGIDISNEEKFLEMADRNRSENKLIYGRILPNIDAVIKNTCKLMDAQEYISGKSSDFDRYFSDQLQNGMYQIEEYYETEKSNEIIGDSATVRSINPNRASKQKKYRIKRHNGSIVRDDTNTLKNYGLVIHQAQVTGIDWEKSFDQRLDLQKDEVAKTQLEKQEAERQYYTAKKEIAAGEAAKAKERARLETAQIQQTIQAETKAKVAKFKVQEEVELLKAGKIAAQTKKVAADATYYENAKRVQAGLTPQERAEWHYKEAVGVASELKHLTLPTTYIEGGTGNKSGDGLLSTLLGAEIAKGMMKK